MKKLLGLGIIAIALSTSAFAQKKVHSHHKDEVPKAVKEAFNKQYPGIMAKWDKEHGKYEADFKQGTTKMSVLYNANGKVEETETRIMESELPNNVTAYVAAHKLGDIKEASKIVKANGTVEYEAEIKAGDALFNSNGDFIKIMKD